MCHFLVDDFVFLQGNPSANDMQKRFDCRVRCLLGAVNRLFIMRLVQPIRKGCTGVGPRSSDAFDLSRNDLVKYTDGHWYAFTTGFREMAQFNIGMSGSYLRAGIGFNISKRSAGPDVGQNVANSFNRFKDVVLKNAQAFKSLAFKLSTYTNSFRVEYGYLPLLPPDVNFIRFIKDVIPDPDNNKFTHPGYGDSEWFFVGAILLPNNYTWECTQNGSQIASRSPKKEADTSPGGIREGIRTNGGFISAGPEGSEDVVNLLDIIERVFTELFPYLGNSLVPSVTTSHMANS